MCLVPFLDCDEAIATFHQKLILAVLVNSLHDLIGKEVMGPDWAILVVVDVGKSASGNKNFMQGIKDIQVRQCAAIKGE